jgi:acetyl esterase
MQKSIVGVWIVLLTVSAMSATAQEKQTLVRPLLDSQCEAFVKASSERPQTDWAAIAPSDARKGFAGLTALFGTGPASVGAEDRKILSTIPVRIYKPTTNKETTAALPVVVYFHGGGWVLGDIETHDALCRRLCSESGCAIVSVGYRLAPEHAFPAPLDDCYAATEYISSHEAEFGVDPARLLVAGDSAGGNLAAAVAIKARNKKGPKILAQVLIYPALDPNCSTASYELFSNGFGLTKADMVWFWQAYLGAKKEGAYSAPCKAQSFAELPRTLIVTAQCDVLRDEGEQYAAKLESAGVAVTHLRYDGMIHGFVHFSGAIHTGQRATTDIATWMLQSTQIPSSK